MQKIFVLNLISFVKFLVKTNLLKTFLSIKKIAFMKQQGLTIYTLVFFLIYSVHVISTTSGIYQQLTDNM